MSLARRFNAGNSWIEGSRRVATIEIELNFWRRYATLHFVDLSRPLKGRAKFMPTLRVEETCSEPLKVCRLCRAGGKPAFLTCKLPHVLFWFSYSLWARHCISRYGARGQRPEDRRQKTEVRRQKSEVRSQKSEVRSQKSEVKDQITSRTFLTSDL
jgi:hypothetical protein